MLWDLLFKCLSDYSRQHGDVVGAEREPDCSSCNVLFGVFETLQRIIQVGIFIDTQSDGIRRNKNESIVSEAGSPIRAFSCKTTNIGQKQNVQFFRMTLFHFANEIRLKQTHNIHCSHGA